MRLTILPLALLAAACSAQQDNIANESANAADNAAAADSTGTASDMPAAVDNGAAPAPGAPGQPVPGQGMPVPPAPAPAASVTLSASPAALPAGATATLRLTNGANQPLGYNLCSSALEAASGRAVATDRMCTKELRTLEPGRSASYAFALPATLAPGNYRFTTSVHWMGTNKQSSATSNAITVTAR